MRNLAGIAAAIALAVGALAAVTGCGAGDTTGAAGSTATASAASQVSPMPASSQPSASATAQAWTRGTNTTYTNNMGATVQIGAGGYGDSAPDIAQSPLTTGASLSVNDPSGSTGSSTFARITYPDGKVAEIMVVNPVVSTPYAEWREGKITSSWSSFHGVSESLDENETSTAVVAGHSITFTRAADDSDNKNWTVTLDS